MTTVGCGNLYNCNNDPIVRTESNESKETGYGSDENLCESEYVTEYEYDNEISRVRRVKRKGEFDIHSHRFFNEYEISSCSSSCCGSYDNDLSSESSSTSSESEKVYGKGQGRVKI